MCGWGGGGSCAPRSPSCGNRTRKPIHTHTNTHTHTRARAHTHTQRLTRANRVSKADEAAAGVDGNAAIDSGVTFRRQTPALASLGKSKRLHHQDLMARMERLTIIPRTKQTPRPPPTNRSHCTDLSNGKAVVDLCHVNVTRRQLVEGKIEGRTQITLGDRLIANSTSLTSIHIDSHPTHTRTLTA